MELREQIQTKLREVYGNVDTLLETQYENKIIYELTRSNLNGKREWLTYNQIILELKHNIKDFLKVMEIQYRITDNEDPNKVCQEVIGDITNLSEELQRLYTKITNF